MTPDAEALALYRAVIDGWNRRDAAAMAAPFSEAARMVGFDGSEVIGRASVEAHLAPIFAGHPTPPYRVIVRRARALGPDAAIVEAIAGMAPPGQTQLEGDFNAVHTLVAARSGGAWKVELFQNTPAALHGRPEAVTAMTRELAEYGE